MKKLNYYYGLDVSVALLILAIMLRMKGSVLYGLVVVNFIILSLGYFSRSKVTNKTNNYVNAKPENASKPIIGVSPGTDHYGFDGIKVGNKVFKARNGTHIVVNKDGSITTKSLTGKMANSFLTGAGYVEKYQMPSDWHPLFDSKFSSPGETVLKNDA